MCENKCTCPTCNSLHQDYVIVRTRSAGVFAGVLKQTDFKSTVTLSNARRLWYWEGAATLSELSQKGVSKPDKCKFPQEVPYVFLPEVIEILPVSDVAQESIRKVFVWKA